MPIFEHPLFPPGLLLIYLLITLAVDGFHLLCHPLLFWALLATLKTDAGPIPNIQPPAQSPKTCMVCGTWKPKAAYHNRESGRCYYRFDHFCSFLRKPIAYKNMRYFCQFLAYMVLLAVLRFFQHALDLTAVLAWPEDLFPESNDLVSFKLLVILGHLIIMLCYFRAFLLAGNLLFDKMYHIVDNCFYVDQIKVRFPYHRSQSECFWEWFGSYTHLFLPLDFRMNLNYLDALEIAPEKRKLVRLEQYRVL